MPDPSTEQIDLYLKQVSSRLQGIREDQVSDILKELRSHILDRTQGAPGFPNISLSAAIESLGTPDQIASEYITEQLIARAQATRTPWSVLRVIIRWASLSLGGFLALAVSTFGYILGAAFLLCALLKPFDPSGVGLWIQSHPFRLSLLVGAANQGPASRELLGWWIIPIGTVAGVALFVLTTKFGLWMIFRFKGSRKKSLVYGKEGAL